MFQLQKNYTFRGREVFKKSLSELKLEGSDNNPLKVFVIDDLDRCNPIYAVKFLEIIKHFFNTENVAFIIAIDKEQLIASIKKFYGITYDAELSLTRFFDFELKLPSDNKTFHQNFLQKNLPRAYLGSPIIPQLINMFCFLAYSPQKLKFAPDSSIKISFDFSFFFIAFLNSTRLFFYVRSFLFKGIMTFFLAPKSNFFTV